MFQSRTFNLAAMAALLISIILALTLDTKRSVIPPATHQLYKLVPIGTSKDKPNGELVQVKLADGTILIMTLDWNKGIVSSSQPLPLQTKPAK